MITPDEFQLAFISHPLTKGECVKLEAVAGSGKTTTSVLKIKSLIESGQFTPEQIVFITFSNKAARDLHKKYKKLTGLTTAPEMSTCHSFSLKMLREYFGVTSTLLNDWSSTLVMRDVLSDMKLDEAYECKDKRALTAVARSFLDLTHWFKSNLIISDPVTTENLGELNYLHHENHPDVNINPKHFREAFVKYEEYKSNSDQMDYSDLLFNLYTNLKSSPAILSKIKQRFPLFIIDECQDNDQLLMRLILLLSGGNTLVTVFDLSQTIYGFRWASPWMLDDDILTKHFTTVTKYPLRYNYRSKANIVNLGNRVRTVLGSEVMAIPNREEEKGSVRLLKVRSNKTEGPMVSKLVKEINASGRKYKDITILARTNSYLKTIIEPALTKSGIPYKLSTKNRKRLFEKPLIQVYFSFITLFTNPENEGALLQIAPHMKGIGAGFLTTARRLSHQGKSVFKYTQSQGDTKKVETLLNLRNKISEATSVADPSSLNLIIILFEQLIRDYFPVNFTTRNDLDLIDKAITSMVFEYYDDFGIRNLHEIFDKILLDFTDIDTETDSNAVTLMTVHGSKGLEFPVTIVGDMARGSAMRDETLFDSGCNLYVQLSRAIDSLIILESQAYVDYKLTMREARYSPAYLKFKKLIGA